MDLIAIDLVFKGDIQARDAVGGTRSSRTARSNSREQSVYALRTVELVSAICDGADTCRRWRLVEGASLGYGALRQELGLRRRRRSDRARGRPAAARQAS